MQNFQSFIKLLALLILITANGKIEAQQMVVAFTEWYKHSGLT